MSDAGLPQPHEGWANHMFSVKHHYIVGGNSLCGLWLNVPGPYEQEMGHYSYCHLCAYEAGKRHAKWEQSE